MGLLTVGDPLDWYETKHILEDVKEQGISQFISLYDRFKDRQDYGFTWGDEIEYLIVKFDHDNKKVYLSLRAEEILYNLTLQESKMSEKVSIWQPEYAAYMLEGTPGRPYGTFSNFKAIEENMRCRRQEASKYLEPDEVLLTIGNFPRTGCPNFTFPSYSPTPNEGITRSLFFPDQALFDGHPRFINLERNVRQRRGENVVINVPVFRDENTPKPFTESFKSMGDDCHAMENAKPDHIYMDATAFGMGCCCFQITFQASNLNEAKWLYDQLTPLAPVLLALSASTPIFRGYLSDVDSRWAVASQAADDRTRDERGFIPKSRYSTSDCYLCSFNSVYNDVPLQFDQKYVDKLIDCGVDEQLAKFVSHMFIREPLQVFRERIDQDGQQTSEHFEAVLSSVYTTVRLKPPPVDKSDIGWRVEFRPMEVQLTDFENAAYACFVALLTRMIISFRLTFVMPISKVDENVLRAQKRDGILTEKFYFRRQLTTWENQTNNEEDYIEMTINEIINGKQPDFPGLISLINQLLNSAEVDLDSRLTIDKYLNFIQCRANGTLCTLSHWMRQFVTGHSLYNNDSIVSEEITYDMLKTLVSVVQRRANCASLLGDFLN